MSRESDPPTPSPPPWRLDRAPLDVPAVTSILARRFPDLAGRPVRFLGRGWDFEAWLAGGREVFRFPLREDVVPWGEREHSLLTYLEGRLPLAVPRPTRRGEPDEDFPYPFRGRDLVVGRGGDEMLPARCAWPRLARALGAFLGTLHALPGPQADAAHPLPRHDATFETLVEQAAALASDVRRALSDASWRVAAPYVEGRVGKPPPFEATPVLQHADLFMEHLIFDPAQGDLVGIIDWADGGYGDPASDLIPFWVGFGDAFLDDLLRAYDAPLDAHVRERVRVHGVLALIRWVGECLHWGWSNGTSLPTWADAVFFPRLAVRSGP